MADEPVVLVDEDEGIFTLTLNRPEKRNAMSPELHYRMHDAHHRAGQYNDKVRKRIVTGAGASFSSGQDLKSYFHLLEGQTLKEARERAREISNQWRGKLLRQFQAPTIAMVNGYCFGGAFTIVASCDIAIAADDATFCLSGDQLQDGTAGPRCERHF